MKSSACQSIARLLILFLALCGPSRGDVNPSPLFSEGAVLQQGVPIPVWGTADPGEKVTVRLGGQAVSMVAGKDGKWKVQLPPHEAGGPFVMTISGCNTLTFSNVMVGEVWVCAGQSNMAFSLGGADTAVSEIPKANYPKLRIFGVGAKGYALPQTALPGGRWVECSPQTAGGFTAVGYFFGRDLLKARSVAVGLISTAWCGTPAEAWTSLDGLKKAKELQGYVDIAQKLADDYPRAMCLLPGRFAKYWAGFTRWNNSHGKVYEKAYAEWAAAAEAAKADGKCAPTPPPAPVGLPPVPPASPDADEGMPKTPTVIFNGRIAPLTPYAIKGVLWYQAEGNAVKAEEYRTLFPCLIADWREKWGIGNFPFLFVQLPAYVKFAPGIREAQRLTLGKSSNTAMVVTTDLGGANELHPANKEPVGIRLALAARAVAYGEKIEYSGPLFQSLEIEGSRAILSFQHTGSGMVAKDGELKGFVIAGADRKFIPAKAEIIGNTVVTSSPEVAAPVAVRYGWNNVPDGNLFNKEGLPASPFRTDDWPVPEKYQQGNI
jgi:sialate O-acetylesterase